jgi:hypothetical protein
VTAALGGWLALGSLAAQAPAAPTAPRPTEPLPATPLRPAALQPVLDHLDTLHRRGDRAAYLAAFAPDHPGCHEQLGHVLASQLTAAERSQRTTRLLDAPRQIQNRTVVRVQHDFAAAEGRAPARVEFALFAFADRSGQAPVPTFCIPLPQPEPHPADARFACPPCNLVFGGATGWLCVPKDRASAQALDAATFYLVGTDLACDLAVHLQPLPAETNPVVAANAAAAALAASLGAASGSRAVRVLPEPWPLPGLDPNSTATTAGTTAGSARVALVPPGAAPDDAQLVAHVAVQGPLQHCLVVRGSRASFAQHRAEIELLLQTYRLLEPRRAPATAASDALQHHSGGTFEGTRYRNPGRVLCVGPEDWRPEQRAGGALFRVVWTSPRGSRLWLHGYAVPAGMERWCKPSAEAWAAELCRQRGLPFADASCGWDGADDCQEHSRSWQARSGQPGAATHHFRLLLRDDLLVLADGVLQHEGDGAALQAALVSLRFQ